MNFFKILLSAIQAYISTFGNKSKVIEAVFDETKNEVITTFVNGAPTRMTVKAPEVPSGTIIPTESSSSNVQLPTQVLPGPTTFNQSVDTPYGKNRKH